MTKRPKFAFSFNDLTGKAPVAPERICDKEGCNKAGEYRAPKDRTLSDYYWFCLEHVQEYNAQWDYYAGMTPDEIENHLKQDVCWQRPTWKLGERGVDPSMFSDPFDLKGEAFGSTGKEYDRGRQPVSDPAIIAAAKILEVGFPLEIEAVRASYKRLAKIYHPDSNGGDKTAEEHFKDVTEAYRLISGVLNPPKG